MVTAEVGNRDGLILMTLKDENGKIVLPMTAAEARAVVNALLGQVAIVDPAVALVGDLSPYSQLSVGYIQFPDGTIQTTAYPGPDLIRNSDRE